MSAMLASDDNNPNFHGARNPDSALHVRFYSRPIQNNWLTQKEGHPIFEDVIYVEIHTPGNQLNIIDTPAREDHKRRFPLHWAHYQNTHGNENAVVGTPINQWPLLTSAQAETLKGLMFLTVEQIAFAGDDAVSKVGMHAGMAPLALRERAKRFLEAAKGEASANAHASEMEAMKQQIADLKALLTAKPAAPAAQVMVSQVPQVATVPPVTPVSEERSALADQYKTKFGKAPHHKMRLETLRERLAEAVAA